MTDLYLGLGSNLGDRERLLYRAVEILVERIGGLKSLSAFYETMFSERMEKGLSRAGGGAALCRFCRFI